MDYSIFIFVLAGLFILFSLFFTVKQQTAVSIERFGKFQSIRHSGLQLKIPVYQPEDPTAGCDCGNQDIGRCICQDQGFSTVCGY